MPGDETDWDLRETVETEWSQMDSETLFVERLEAGDVTNRSATTADDTWKSEVAAARTRQEKADETVDHARTVERKLLGVHEVLLRGAERVDRAELDRALSSLEQAVSTEEVLPLSAFHGLDGSYGYLDVSTDWPNLLAQVEKSGQDEERIGTCANFFGNLAAAASEIRHQQEERIRSLTEEAYTGIGDPLQGLADEPILMAPVQLETRFVDEDTDFKQDLDVDREELWVRVYPDQFHVDSHEKRLTEREIRWGKNFWATLWLAHVGDPEATDSLPSDRLKQYAETLDLSSYGPPAAAVPRMKSRVWGQLVDRFGEERATYVIHALSPTDGNGTDLGPPLLSETPTDALGSRTEETELFSRDREIVTEPTSLVFPDDSADGPGEKADSWTKQANARLLPDRWIAVLEWEDRDTGKTKKKTVEGAPIPEPLPVGPDIEPGEQAEADADWTVDFREAFTCGMALRIRTDELEGYDGNIDRLVVLGVKGSLDPTETPAKLRSQLDAHRYTDGFSLVDAGTPTNVPEAEPEGALAENPVGPRSPQDVEMALTDGDLLARTLGLETDGEHPFVHVEGATATAQRDARHANTVLWPATLGYSMSHLWMPDDLATIELDASMEWNDRLGTPLAKLDQYRRHFIRYVRPRGPLPTLRIENQPYGILPVRTPGDEPADEDAVSTEDLLIPETHELEPVETDVGRLRDLRQSEIDDPETFAMVEDETQSFSGETEAEFDATDTTTDTGDTL